MYSQHATSYYVLQQQLVLRTKSEEATGTRRRVLFIYLLLYSNLRRQYDNRIELLRSASCNYVLFIMLCTDPRSHYHSNHIVRRLVANRLGEEGGDM